MPGAFPGTSADIEGDHLSALGLEGDPDPLFIVLASDKAPHFIEFQDQTLQWQGTTCGDRPKVEILRQAGIEWCEKAEQPGQRDPRAATDSTQTKALEQESVDELALV